MVNAMYTKDVKTEINEYKDYFVLKAAQLIQLLRSR